MKKTFENINPNPVCFRLKELRIKLGYLNKSNFASELGVKPQTYQNYESDRMPPSEFFYKLAKKFKRRVDMSWLLTGEGHSNGEGEQAENNKFIEMTKEVLDSENEFSSSLKTLIRTMHQAMNGEEKFKALEKELEKVGCKQFVRINESRIRHDDPPQEKEEILKRRAF